MEESRILEETSQETLSNLKPKTSPENSNSTVKFYDAELGSPSPSRYAYQFFNTSREIEIDVGAVVRLNHKGRHSIRQTEGKSIQYSYDGLNWRDFYDGASGEISLTPFNYREPEPGMFWSETDSDSLDIKGFVIPPKTMWVRTSTQYADYYKFQHVLKIIVKNTLNKDIFTTFGSIGTTNPVDMGNTEKTMPIIAGQTISFQGGYSAGTDILEVKYTINGKEYHGHTKDHKNFSFGPMGHVEFVDKGYVRYRYSEILGEITPPYFPPDGKLQLEVKSKYFRKIVTHKLNIEVRILEFKDIVIHNESSWANITLPKNAAYFYIPAKATGPDHMNVQWYYQAPQKKDWIKIEGSNGFNFDPPIQGLMFYGATENTLVVSGTLNKPENSKNGLKFRAVFTDDMREVSELTQATTINFSKQLEYSITPVGYRVLNGKIDTTQELSLPNIRMPYSPYLSHQSKANLGSLGNQDAILRKARAIIGTDDRTQIKNPTLFPYRAIGSLEVSFKYQDAQGKFLTGSATSTAWLVSKDTAVTVGHTIFSHEMKVFVENIKFHVFWENGSFQREAGVEEIWLDKNFLKVNSSFVDWAILKLKKPSGKDKHIGEELGWLGYESNPSIHAYDHHSLSTVHPTPNGIFWLSHGKILRSTPNSLYIDLDTDYGSSGAPILTEENSAIATFVGVPDVSVLGKENDTCRITSELFNVISHIKDK